MIPPGRHGGRRRFVNVREVLNGIFYVLWTGCQWKALLKDLPPKSTVHDDHELWNWDGTLERIHHTLYVAVREEEGREASPTVAIIDSQSAKGAQRGSGLDPSGYDAGKKIKGRKRHILVDTLGLLLNVVVHPADIQDRDGALRLRQSRIDRAICWRSEMLMLCRLQVTLMRGSSGRSRAGGRGLLTVRVAAPMTMEETEQWAKATRRVLPMLVKIQRYERRTAARQAPSDSSTVQVEESDD